MVSKAAQKTFNKLKMFPRTKNGAIDDGSKSSLLEPLTMCVDCGKPLYETVSLEFCDSCGYIETDYWGILPWGRDK